MKTFARVCDALDMVAKAGVAAALSGIFLLTTVNAVLRYIFHINILWSYDLLRILFLFVTFFGIPVVYKRKNHARYVFVDSHLKGTPALVVHQVIHLLSAIFFLVVVVESANLIASTRVQIMPASRISAMWLYAPLFVGCAICLVQTLYFMAEELTAETATPAGEAAKETA